MEQKVSELRSGFDDTAVKLKDVEKLISDKNVLSKHIKTYQALRPVYAEYRKAKNKSEFENKHRRELTLFNASHRYLSDVQAGGKLPALDRVNTELAELTDRKNALYEKYKKDKKALAEIDIIKTNVDVILGRPHNKEHTKETSLD